MISDIGRYTLFPEWVFSVSDVAMRTFILLGLNADRQSHETFKSHATLAKESGMSVASLKRGTRELMDVGALEVETRVRPDGSQSSNLYRLHFANPDPVVWTGEGVTADPPPHSDETPLDLEDLDLDGFTDVKPGRLQRLPKREMHLAVVNHVWTERTRLGTMPFQASRGRLHQIAKGLVDKVGDERAVEILMGVMDFTPGCVNYELSHTNGKVVVKPPDPDRPLSMAEKAAIRHAAQRKATNGTDQ